MRRLAALIAVSVMTITTFSTPDVARAAPSGDEPSPGVAIAEPASLRGTPGDARRARSDE